jgi:hypothetical protein
MDLYAVATAGPRLSGVKALAALFATMDPGRAYVADAGEWAEALLKLRDECDDRCTPFFESIDFVQSPGSKPYSRQVSQFLTYMQMGGVVEVPNPSYAILRIKPDAQRDMLKLYLADEAVAAARDAMEGLVAPLSDALAVEVHTAE